MAGIFISYRAGDGDWAATLIARELATRFGPGEVFLASKAIRPGSDFTAEILTRIPDCDVLLAVIGPGWADGRIDGDGDWVHREIAEAFRHGLRVIPVLLDRVDGISESGLPADIAALARARALARPGHPDQLLVLNQPSLDVWDLRRLDTGRPVSSVRVGLVATGALTDAAIVADAQGSRVAVVSESGAVTAWDIDTAEPSRPITNGPGHDTILGFGPDDTLVIEPGDGDPEPNQAQIWDLPGNRLLATVPSLANLTDSWRLQGDRLTTRMADSALTIDLPLDQDATFRDLCRTAGRDFTDAERDKLPEGAATSPPCEDIE